MVKQGEVYIIDFGIPAGSEPGYRRPCVVVQKNLLNRSALRTTTVCLLTSNLARAAIPHNILLKRAETGLKRDSVAVATQIATLDKGSLESAVGKIPMVKLRKLILSIQDNIVCEV